MTAPHEVLAKLREENGLAQMRVFAEALYSNSNEGAFQRLSLIASAYMLGRSDALRGEIGEVDTAAGPMAESVLNASHVLQDFADVAF